ncbi:MAG: hypothetical protein P8X89_22355 [Reinekea sp.]
MLPKNFNEPMGAPAIFEKQIESRCQIQGIQDRLLLRINGFNLI